MPYPLFHMITCMTTFFLALLLPTLLHRFHYYTGGCLFGPEPISYIKEWQVEQRRRAKSSSASLSSCLIPWWTFCHLWRRDWCCRSLCVSDGCLAELLLCFQTQRSLLSPFCRLEWRFSRLAPSIQMEWQEHFQLGSFLIESWLNFCESLLASTRSCTLTFTRELHDNSKEQRWPADCTCYQSMQSARLPSDKIITLLTRSLHCDEVGMIHSHSYSQ